MHRKRERERLNILVIKIHLESNSNSPCVECLVAYLLYFLQFEEVVGANFCGFALSYVIFQCNESCQIPL